MLHYNCEKKTAGTNGMQYESKRIFLHLNIPYRTNVNVLLQFTIMHAFATISQITKRRAIIIDRGYNVDIV